MNDDYCELCDLPRSTCIHGRPPAVPEKPVKAAKVKAAPRPRKQAPARVPARMGVRRFTSPEALKPLILEVLRSAGGELPADDVYRDLEILAEDQLLPGDRETTPTGELRWRYAARRARLALIEDGSMAKGHGDVWQLAR